MKKKVLLRALLGAPIGLSIGFLVTLLVSAGFGDGKFYPVTPELTALCGMELRAVAVQTAAYFMHWMPHTVGGILGYFGIFLGIYAGIWLGNYLSVRARIRAMNEKLHGKE